MSLLREAGLDVGHERFGADGCVSSYLAVSGAVTHGPHRVRGERREHASADEVWHLVRHPLDVIGSIASGMGLGWWRWQASHTGIARDLQPRLVRAARFWLDWTDRIDADREAVWRWQVEEIAEHWPQIAHRLGLRLLEPHHFNPLIGSSRRPDAVRAEVAEIPPPLLSRIRDKALRYGYAPEDFA